MAGIAESAAISRSNSAFASSANQQNHSNTLNAQICFTHFVMLHLMNTRYLSKRFKRRNAVITPTTAVTGKEKCKSQSK